MSRTRDEWFEYLKTINFEFIKVVNVGEHNIATCICQCGKQFTKTASKLRECSNCGCLKNFVNSRAQKRYFSNPDNRAKTSKAMHLHYDNHPEVKLKISESVKQWCADHIEERLNIGQKYSQWCKNNEASRKEINQKIAKWQSNNRHIMSEINNRKREAATQERLEIIKSNLDSNSLESVFDLLHSDFHSMFINGKITSNDQILTKCPKCNSYDVHYFRDVFKYSTFEITTRPLCHDCYNSFTVSHYEQEIADYIFTFYNGALIRNSREVIAPLELDLYYPEKNIAIEFNGDYWHDENHKQKDYHLNKYLQCKEKGILLVSIFESEWLSKKEEIKSYLRDLFNHIDNDLSFISDGSKMNNNYPAPSCMSKLLKTEESYYTANESKVFTCGYTKLK